MGSMADDSSLAELGAADATEPEELSGPPVLEPPTSSASSAARIPCKNPISVRRRRFTFPARAGLADKAASAFTDDFAELPPSSAAPCVLFVTAPVFNLPYFPLLGPLQLAIVLPVALFMLFSATFFPSRAPSTKGGTVTKLLITFRILSSALDDAASSLLIILTPLAFSLSFGSGTGGSAKCRWSTGRRLANMTAAAAAAAFALVPPLPLRCAEAAIAAILLPAALVVG
mmetsp:Transcript_21113/g.61387  ORF Transcript_21113/g.61387 Transcript_21113/m.61387 type:complete len:230 (-) Transcript_21113:1574-2263(-)